MSNGVRGGMMGTALIVDDEQELARDLARYLDRRGLQTAVAHSAAAAREQMQQICPDVVLLDLRLPDARGGELLVELKERHPRTEFIIITAYGSIRSAVESTRQGAVEYLTKPFEPEQVAVAIDNVLSSQTLDEEVQRLRSRCMPAARSKEPALEPRRTRSAAMCEMITLMKKVAAQDGIVLLTGESGVGKDHYARWIHQQSRRSAGPFFDINCAALAPELASSELFGHEPGAFTGTCGRKRGLLELANEGTLLLNEVGELDLPLQSKLLTFLDTRCFIRVGGERRIRVDARIIAATNRDLAEEVERGRFRRDLFYRLKVLPICIPPLRERVEDIPQLVGEVLDTLAGDLYITPQPSIAADALVMLQEYAWPGNIRELRNVLERAIMLNGGVEIQPQHLCLDRTDGADEHSGWKLEVAFEPGRNLHEVSRGVTRKLVSEALRRSQTKQQAAELLGISRHALAHQIRQLGLET